MELFRSRREIYEDLADAFLPDMPRRGASRTAGALRSLRAAPAGTRLLWASSSSGEYPVLVGAGLLASGGGALGAIWPLDLSRSRGFCVSDERVAALYGERLAGLRQVARDRPRGGAQDARQRRGGLARARRTPA